MARLSISRVKAALELTGGVKAAAARQLKVGRTTLWRFVNAYPQLIAFIAEIDAEITDLAEGKLIQLIRAGDGPSIRFYLERKAKDRGYGLHTEITGPGGGPVQTVSRIDLSSLTGDERSQVRSILSRLADDQTANARH